MMNTRLLKAILIGLTALLIVSILILSSVPPVSRDALTHHLAVPKLYLKQGGMYEIPSLPFSYNPGNLDLLYLIALYGGNDIIPKFIHFAFALLTAWLFFNYLKKRIDTLHALMGLLLFLSLPVIVKLSITVYVDLGLVFFSTAALLYCLKWIENEYRLKYLFISAVCCGLALGTKYNGLIVFFILALFVPLLHLRLSPRLSFKSSRAIGYGILFVMIAITVFSPWLIRNYVWTGNPIYPLYDNLINQTHPDAFNALGPFAIRKIIYKESGWQIALIPLRIFFQGLDGNPQYFDGRLNPYLFVLPFFAFLKHPKNPSLFRTEKMILLTYSILYLSFAFVRVDMRIRYIAPIIPPLVILSVFGLKQIKTMFRGPSLGMASKIFSGSVWVGVSILLLFNAIYIWGQFNTVAPFDYINGKIGREAYIEKYRPEYSALKYANQNLPEDVKILSLFLGQRLYYSDREMRFDIDLFQKTIKHARSAEVILRDLKEKGFTHLLVGRVLFDQWVHINFDKRQKRLLREFFKNDVKSIFSKGGYALFQL